MSKPTPPFDAEREMAAGMAQMVGGLVNAEGPDNAIPAAIRVAEELQRLIQSPDAHAVRRLAWHSQFGGPKADALYRRKLLELVERRGSEELKRIFECGNTAGGTK